MDRRSHGRRCMGRGFTLVELCVVLAVAGVLTALAWPSFDTQWQRARRVDAVAALTQAQAAQERYRSAHGLYSAQLAALGTPPRSPEGLYEIAVQGGGDSVVLAATARAGSPQQRDAECREITLRLNQGFAEQGPSPRCWMK